jgi:hypothetical protein
MCDSHLGPGTGYISPNFWHLTQCCPNIVLYNLNERISQWLKFQNHLDKKHTRLTCKYKVLPETGSVLYRRVQTMGEGERLWSLIICDHQMEQVKSLASWLTGKFLRCFSSRETNRGVGQAVIYELLYFEFLNCNLHNFKTSLFYFLFFLVRPLLKWRYHYVKMFTLQLFPGHEGQS